jgi:hypothetical protein
VKHHRLRTLQTLFGFTFLFGFGFYLILSLVLINIADIHFGFWGRMIVGVFALLGFLFVFMRYFYRIWSLLDARRRDEAREKYRGIYRVIAFPTAHSNNPWQLQHIEVGDYGWEAEPLTNDGRIYLQGLTKDWGMVWRAGFRPDQIEYVGPKPVSQYDWRDFEYDGPKPKACYQWQHRKPKQPCPFPVQTRTKYERLQFRV